jgi:hypothetical protein
MCRSKGGVTVQHEGRSLTLGCYGTLLVLYRAHCRELCLGRRHLGSLLIIELLHDTTPCQLPRYPVTPTPKLSEGGARAGEGYLLPKTHRK